MATGDLSEEGTVQRRLADTKDRPACGSSPWLLSGIAWATWKPLLPGPLLGDSGRIRLGLLNSTQVMCKE